MIHIPQNDYEWWSFFTAYCRDKFLKYSRKGKPIWEAMYLAYEQTIELRTIPGLETRFNSVNFEVKDKWAEKYDKVVTTLYFNTDPDKVRFCEQCGFPMVEGYYLAGEFACCDECCLPTVATKSRWKKTSATPTNQMASATGLNGTKLSSTKRL